MAKKDFAEFGLSPETRRKLTLIVGAIFVALPLCLAVYGVWNLLYPRPQDGPGVGWVLLFFGLVALAFGVPSVIYGPRARRLIFRDDYVVLPSIGFAPWCFAAQTVLHYSSVVRWGSHIVQADQSTIVILEKMGAEKTERSHVSLFGFDRVEAILAEFSKHLPPPVPLSIDPKTSLFVFQDRQL